MTNQEGQAAAESVLAWCNNAAANGTVALGDSLGRAAQDSYKVAELSTDAQEKLDLTISPMLSDAVAAAEQLRWGNPELSKLIQQIGHAATVLDDLVQRATEQLELTEVAKTTLESAKKGFWGKLSPCQPLINGALARSNRAEENIRTAEAKAKTVLGGVETAEQTLQDPGIQSHNAGLMASVNARAAANHAGQAIGRLTEAQTALNPGLFTDATRAFQSAQPPMGRQWDLQMAEIEVGIGEIRKHLASISQNTHSIVNATTLAAAHMGKQQEVGAELAKDYMEVVAKIQDAIASLGMARGANLQRSGMVAEATEFTRLTDGDITNVGENIQRYLSTPY